MKYKREGRLVVPVLPEKEEEDLIVGVFDKDSSLGQGPPDPHEGTPSFSYPIVYESYGNFFQGLPDIGMVEDRYNRVMAKAKKRGELKEVMAEMGRRDRYFFFTRILRRRDGVKPFVYKMCRLLEYYGEDNEGDFWAREHYKSSLKSFAGGLQDVVKNPELTTGIFGYTKRISNPFLVQWKREMEGNELLKWVYDDVFYGNPENESPLWSSRDGLIVKRKTNPKEPTFAAHGLVRNQPTGIHLTKQIYNDAVEKESASSKLMTDQTIDAWEKSRNLVDTERVVTIYEGTFWSYGDAYQTMIGRGAINPRIAPATLNGMEDGEPAMWTRDQLEQKRKEYGPFNFACQILLDPLKKSKRTFHFNWLKYWDNRNLTNLNTYIIVDPASQKKDNADYTAVIICAMGADNIVRVVGLLQDRLSLTERTRLVFNLYQKYNCKGVYYEKYGKDSDIEHIQYVQREKNFSFPIFELGGKMSKEDRILRLVPWFENGRIMLPHVFKWETQDGTVVDFVDVFIRDQYLKFPFRVTDHDDLFDAMARIVDVRFQKPEYETSPAYDYLDEEETYDPKYLEWEAG
jgi:predicted phage terminase large subunit-like protein